MIETSLKSQTFVSQMKEEKQANGFSFNLARAQKVFSQHRNSQHRDGGKKK